MSLPNAILLAATVAGAAPGSAPVLRPRIERVVTRALGSTALKHASLAVDVRLLPSGRPVYRRNADLSMTPASSLKLATTAAALDAFGPDARFRTTLEAAARPDSRGHLRGDLYLVPGGDPSLSRELESRPDFGVFELMAESLRAAGVTEVEGRLVGCDGLFGRDRRGHDWSWEDLVWWYGAEVAPITFADGAANLKLIPGARPGDAVVIERHPPSDFYRVESTVATCATAGPSDLHLDRRLGGNVIEVGGCVLAGGAPLERFVALEDPVRYATTVLAEALRAKGISVGGGVATAPLPPEGISALVGHDGAPLAEILKDVNKPSHNLRAEMLLRLLGQKAKGEGSADAGRDAVLLFLKAHDVDVSGWDLYDGSGLSRSDLVTAAGVADLLVAMDSHPHAAVFRASLPEAGVDGTLKRRFAGTGAAGRIHAKTGTLRHTSALAGYATPPRGERLAFAIFVNQATAPIGDVQEAIDSIAAALVGR